MWGPNGWGLGLLPFLQGVEKGTERLEKCETEHSIKIVTYLRDSDSGVAEDGLGDLFIEQGLPFHHKRNLLNLGPA